MIKTKDIKTIKHISDLTEEKLNNLKLVSQETNKDVVSTQGESTKDILKARSIERLDALNADSTAFDNKIGEIETSVAEELTEITDRTETVISNSEKYKQDIEAFLSVAKGDDFLFFLDDCTRAVGRLDKLTDGSYLCRGKKITSWDIPLPELKKGYGMFSQSNLKTWGISLPMIKDMDYMFQMTQLISWTIDLPTVKFTQGMFLDTTSLISFTGSLPSLKNGINMFSGTNLTNFSSKLSSLLYGNGMFDTCKLNLESIQNIADTINDLTALSETGYITIGISADLQENSGLDEAIQTIINKGWTVIKQYN